MRSYPFNYAFVGVKYRSPPCVASAISHADEFTYRKLWPARMSHLDQSAASLLRLAIDTPSLTPAKGHTRPLHAFELPVLRKTGVYATEKLPHKKQGRFANSPRTKTINLNKHNKPPWYWIALEKKITRIVDSSPFKVGPLPRYDNFIPAARSWISTGPIPHGNIGKVSLFLLSVSV